MKFPWQPRKKKEPKPGETLFSVDGQNYTGAIFWFEGERLRDSYVHDPAVVETYCENEWRPEGEALPDYVEVIPGYERPVNWREIQARTIAELKAKVVR